MEDLKLILKQTIKLEEFVSNRAKELFMALGSNYAVNVTGVSFEENRVIVSFIEITRHDCPNTDSIILDVSQLEMGDNQWRYYIETKRAETLEKELNKRNDVEKRILSQKQNEFARLKQELGY